MEFVSRICLTWTSIGSAVSLSTLNRISDEAKSKAPLAILLALKIIHILRKALFYYQPQYFHELFEQLSPSLLSKSFKFQIAA